jgi:hypothetical protein
MIVSAFIQHHELMAIFIRLSLPHILKPEDSVRVLIPWLFEKL